MKPTSLKTKIFLDSGNPNETREIIKLLGFLDGQTTNPTLISKNPNARSRLEKGKGFTKEEIFKFYKEIVAEISGLIPNGSVSVEVYADKNTNHQEMLNQGREMFSWIPNAHIKYPTTYEGLTAAEQAVKEGMRINMTLCFSQEQAAAVYAATIPYSSSESAQRTSREVNNEAMRQLNNQTTKDSSRQARTINNGMYNRLGLKNVFVSPFIGRLDDRGENGMDLIKNIIRMYKSSDHHVEVLTASVRNLDHFLYAIKLESDIITAPFKILKEWAEKGMPMPDESFKYNASNLKPILYQKIDLNKPWREYNIKHDLTNIGIDKFSSDWNSLLLNK